jgi:hypothetical protein
MAVVFVVEVDLFEIFSSRVLVATNAVTCPVDRELLEFEHPYEWHFESPTRPTMLPNDLLVVVVRFYCRCCGR